jgi:dihydropteroate synthase
VVGVVNVTPDSFSDGGRFLDADASVRHVDRLLDEGADVVEIGGESTRPAGADYGAGYVAVSPDAQRARILPSIRHAVARGATVAVDTTSAAVAAAALAEGARIVNDVSCLADPALAAVAAAHDAWLVLMHARPGASSIWSDVVEEVCAEWCRARDRAVAAGVRPEAIVFDPGLGFGKAPPESLRLLAAIPRLRALGHPVYVGASRKGLVAWAEQQASLPKSPPASRDPGTVAVTAFAHRSGAHAIRVHDVHGTRQALAVLDALALAEGPGAAAPRGGSR